MAGCAQRAFRIWEQGKEGKLTQLIFSDLSTPKGDGSFNVYEDIRDVGLSPFDRQPSIEKVLIEGVVYYIGVAIIEELYVRGLLLNLIEKMMEKNKNSTLIAVVLSAVIFGVGHIFGMLSQPLLVIVSKVVWTIGMGIFFGMVYAQGYWNCSLLF